MFPQCSCNIFLVEGQCVVLFTHLLVQPWLFQPPQPIHSTCKLNIMFNWCHVLELNPSVICCVSCVFALRVAMQTWLSAVSKGGIATLCVYTPCSDVCVQLLAHFNHTAALAKQYLMVVLSLGEVRIVILIWRSSGGWLFVRFALRDGHGCCKL